MRRKVGRMWGGGGLGREEQRGMGDEVHVRELTHAQNTARGLALSIQ